MMQGSFGLLFGPTRTFSIVRTIFIPSVTIVVRLNTADTGHVHTSAENDVLVVEPLSSGTCNEELTTVCVGT